ncbi:ATP-binding protein, partial [Salmonella enterica]|nr:ATP-binding protein [Salmonella enterica]
MIKPDWNIFKAKFSDNPQYHFEWFCYLLFCKQFDKPYGIFRYKNQSAIETNPITHEHKRIGFQAKFYESSLSEHKQEILDTLKKAKRDYSDLNTIIFYSNQEWGQAHSQDKPAAKSKALVDIEKEALNLNLELEWCTASFFESHFVSIDCEKISKYFFQTDSNLIKFIDYLDMHTNLILSPIQNQIVYKGNEITFNRSEILNQLENTSSYNISILSGEGGIGKTVEIKNLYYKLRDTVPFFVFKATEFEINRLKELNHDGNIYDFAEYFDDSESKVIVIDSAEKLLDLSNQEPIKEFISLISKCNWKIIFTTRSSYLNDLNFLCMEVLNSTPLSIYIPPLKIEELEKLASSNNFPLPKDDKLIELLQIPLYLSEYLKIIDYKESFDYNHFKNKLWRTKIKRHNIERELVFLNLAFERVNEGLFFIKASNDNIDIIRELVHDGILGIEQNTYFIVHDLYEEWALERIINQEYSTKNSTSNFFMTIGSSLPMRRAFRSWISDRLSQDSNDIEVFIEDLIDNEALDSFWKDEVIVSILLSKYSKTFFDYFDDELITTKFDLFKRVCFMLRIACKEFDNQVLSNLGLKPIAKTLLPYGSLFTMPKGEGWVSLIEFLHRKIDLLDKSHANFILPIIHDWNNKNKDGYTTKLSSLIALKFYQLEAYRHISKADDAHHLLTTIACGAKEIKEELSTILDEVITQKYTDYNDPYIGLSYLILANMAGLHIANALPEKTLSLAKLFWLKDYTDKHDPMFFSRDGEEEPYGITDDYNLKYYPESPYQTPILSLLASNQKATIDFIIEFINKVAKNLIKYYGEGKFSQISINNAPFTSTIYSAESLWTMYRGAPANVPNLVSSILMALEKFFIARGKSTPKKDLEYWLLYILKNSNSTIAYGLVNSIVLAFPDKTYNI